MLREAVRWQRYLAFPSCVSVSNLSNCNKRGNFTNNRCTSTHNNTPWCLRLKERNCVWIINVKSGYKNPSLAYILWSEIENWRLIRKSWICPSLTQDDFFSREIIAFRKVKKKTYYFCFFGQRREVSCLLWNRVLSIASSHRYSKVWPQTPICYPGELNFSTPVHTIFHLHLATFNYIVSSLR